MTILGSYDTLISRGTPELNATWSRVKFGARVTQVTPALPPKSIILLPSTHNKGMACRVPPCRYEQDPYPGRGSIKKPSNHRDPWPLTQLWKGNPMCSTKWCFPVMIPAPTLHGEMCPIPVSIHINSKESIDFREDPFLPPPPPHPVSPHTHPPSHLLNFRSAVR